VKRFWLGILSLSVAGVASAQSPSVLNNGVVNAASFAPQQPVAPGSMVAIFGTNLTDALARAGSIPLSTSMSNVSVTLNGVPAALFGVFPGSLAQINAQVPWDVLPQGVAAGSVSIVVTKNGVSSLPTNVQIQQSEPGVFTVNAQGFGQGVVTTVDGSAFVGPVGAIPGLNSQPAKIGDFIIVWATGLGPVDLPPANGDIPRSGLTHTLTTPAVLIGGVPQNVTFSGLNGFFVGLYQINVQIMPGTPTGDAVPIQIQMGGVTSTDKVTIAVTQ
jgi:uncharacterized protein (TIGR03437 family)